MLLLAKLWPYLLGAAVFGGGGAWVAHKADSVAYSRLQATYASYQAQVAEAAATAQEAARKALQEQIDARQQADARNQGVINALAKRAAGAESDAALARRLFIASEQARTAATGHQVPAPGPIPGPSPLLQPQGPGRINQLVAARLNECDANEAEHDALMDELLPQLGKPK